MLIVPIAMLQVAKLISNWRIKYSHQRTFAYTTLFDTALDRKLPNLKHADSFLVTPVVWEVASSKYKLTAKSDPGLDPNTVHSNLPSVYQQMIQQKGKKRRVDGVTKKPAVANQYEVKALARYYNVDKIAAGVRRCIQGLGTPIVTVIDYAEVLHAAARPKANPNRQSQGDDNDGDGNDASYDPGASSGAAGTSTTPTSRTTRTATAAPDNPAAAGDGDGGAAVKEPTGVDRHDQLVVFLIAMVQAYDCANVHAQQFLNPELYVGAGEPNARPDNARHCRVHLLAAVGDASCAAALGVAVILGCDAVVCCSADLKPTLQSQHTDALKYMFRDQWPGAQNRRQPGSESESESDSDDLDGGSKVTDSLNNEMDTDAGLAGAWSDDDFVANQVQAWLAFAPPHAADTGKGKGRGRGRGRGLNSRTGRGRGRGSN